MNANELYAAGQLAEAVAAAGEDVKRHPTDQAKRAFFCELLCFAGNLDRADLQLDTIVLQDPKAAVVVSLFRQLLRAEQARRQFFQEGRLPEFLDQPSPRLKLHLEASICLREGNAAGAANLLQRAEQERPVVAGTCDGRPFEGLRDLDDLTSSFFEVLTSTGKYYWIPMESVELIEFRAPQRARDLLWRSAHMIVRGGPDGEVHLPAVYAGSQAESDDRLRLGRLTEWRGDPAAPVRGAGQRVFLVGEEDRSIMEIKEITLNAPAANP